MRAEEEEEGATHRAVLGAGVDVCVSILLSTGEAEGVGGLVDAELPLSGGQEVVLEEEEEGDLLWCQTRLAGHPMAAVPI